MKLNELLNEKYDKEHTCLTPGTMYHIKINDEDKEIKIKLNLPDSVKELSEKDSVDIESSLHYAIEKVLAKYYF